jgi:hypothetical protein
MSCCIDFVKILRLSLGLNAVLCVKQKMIWIFTILNYANTYTVQLLIFVTTNTKGKKVTT